MIELFIEKFVRYCRKSLKVWFSWMAPTISCAIWKTKRFVCLLFNSFCQINVFKRLPKLLSICFCFGVLLLVQKLVLLVLTNQKKRAVFLTNQKQTQSTVTWLHPRFPALLTSNVILLRNLIGSSS